METVRIQNRFDIRTETRYFGACHTCLGDISRTSAEYHLIGSLHMSMSSQNCGNTVGKIMSQSS